MAIRRSDFAGSWYPSNETECRRAIEEMMMRGRPCPVAERKFVGGIVPHAGWFYSGEVACSVIRCLQTGGAKPDTIAVFGRHLHPGGRNYIMKEDRWATPLGELEVDRDLAGNLTERFPFILETGSKYEQDNTIEVQLPFIKHFFPDVMILPVGVPPSLASLAIGEAVVEIAETMGRKILVIGSTDLTHYGPNYGFVPKGIGKEAVEWAKNQNDMRVRELIMRMDAARVIQEASKNHNACCAGAVATAIAAAKKSGAQTGMELFYTTSYDIRPDSSFVGYTGMLFC